MATTATAEAGPARLTKGKRKNQPGFHHQRIKIPAHTVGPRGTEESLQKNPVFGTKCNHCGKDHHFKQMCKSNIGTKSMRNTVHEDASMPGCQSCLAGFKIVKKLGLSTKDLIPVDNHDINILGPTIPWLSGKVHQTNGLCNQPHHPQQEACTNLGKVPYDELNRRNQSQQLRHHLHTTTGIPMPKKDKPTALPAIPTHKSQTPAIPPAPALSTPVNTRPAYERPTNEPPQPTTQYSSTEVKAGLNRV